MYGLGDAIAGAIVGALVIGGIIGGTVVLGLWYLVPFLWHHIAWVQ